MEVEGGRMGYLQAYAKEDDETEDSVGENARKHVELVQFPGVDFVEYLQTGVARIHAFILRLRF